jgi:hypothetical protein
MLGHQLSSMSTIMGKDPSERIVSLMGEYLQEPSPWSD